MDMHLPANITDRAISLREQADKSGVLPILHQLGIHEAIVPYSTRLDNLSIDEMSLTVRSSNVISVTLTRSSFGKVEG